MIKCAPNLDLCSYKLYDNKGMTNGGGGGGGIPTAASSVCCINLTFSFGFDIFK